MKTGNSNFGWLSEHLHGKFLKLWNSFSYFGTCHIYICMTLFPCTFHPLLRLTRLWNEISPCNPHVPIPCALRHPPGLSPSVPRGPTAVEKRDDIPCLIFQCGTQQSFTSHLSAVTLQDEMLRQHKSRFEAAPSGDRDYVHLCSLLGQSPASQDKLTISSDINVKSRHTLTDNYFGLVCGQQEKRTHYVNWIYDLYPYTIITHDTLQNKKAFQ